MSLDKLFEKDETFTPADLMKATGITREIYNQWLFRDIFQATYEADGPGTSSKFTLKDILKVYLVNLFRSYDIRLKKASRLADAVVEKFGHWRSVNEGNSSWPIYYLEIGSKGKIIVDDKEKLSIIAIRINLDVILGNIRANVDGEFG